MLPTVTKKVVAVIAVVVLFLMPFSLPVINQIPIVRFLGDSNWIRLMMLVFILAIAALGLNVLTGMAGQVSLGHAFFMGVGAYSARRGRRRGIGATCGAGAGRCGCGSPPPASAPPSSASSSPPSPSACAASTWRSSRSGSSSSASTWQHVVGPARSPATPDWVASFPAFDIRLWKEETPLVSMETDSHWLWFDVTDTQKQYLFLAALHAAVRR